MRCLQALGKICMSILFLSSMMLPLKAQAAHQDRPFEAYESVQPKLESQVKGTLIMSDSPETIKEEGILYESFAKKGKGRLLFHHVNETGEALEAICCIQNTTARPQIFALTKKSIPLPSPHVLHTGQQVLLHYLEPMQVTYYFMAPGEKLYFILPEQGAWRPHTLLSGIIDFEATEEIHLTLYAHKANSSLADLGKLHYLEKGVTPRGTFNYLDAFYRVTLEKPGFYKWGIGKDATAFQKGYDAVIGKPSINYGNYGVMVHLKLYCAHETLVVVCPRGGVYKGAISVDGQPPVLVERKHCFKRKKEVVILEVLPKGGEYTLHYMLPNGSAAPVYIGFIILKDS